MTTFDGMLSFAIKLPTKSPSQSSQHLPVVPCWEQDFNLGTLARTWKIQTTAFYPTQCAFSLSGVPTSLPFRTTQRLHSKFSALAKLSFQPLWKKVTQKVPCFGDTVAAMPDQNPTGQALNPKSLCSSLGTGSGSPVPVTWLLQATSALLDRFCILPASLPGMYYSLLASLPSFGFPPPSLSEAICRDAVLPRLSSEIFLEASMTS